MVEPRAVHSHLFAECLHGEVLIADVCLDDGLQTSQELLVGGCLLRWRRLQSVDDIIGNDSRLDPDTINHVYVSLPTKNGEVNENGVYELWKYVIDDEGIISSKTQLTHDSKKNNVRPYVLPGSADTPLRLAWMNGDYYFWVSNANYPQGYPTSIVADGEIPVQPIDLEQGLGTNADATTFTISVQATMPKTASTYLGTFFTNERLALKVVADYLLQLTVDHQDYNGSGRFLATDHYYRGVAAVTGQSAALLPKVTMTLTYDGQRLTLYRNELVDLQLTAQAKGLPKATIQLETSPISVAGGLTTYKPADGLKPRLDRGETPSGPSFRQWREEVPITRAIAASGDDVTRSYDNCENTSWESAGRLDSASVTYTLAEKTRIDEICMKLKNFRSTTYPIAVYAHVEKADGSEKLVFFSAHKLFPNRLPVREFFVLLHR